MAEKVKYTLWQNIKFYGKRFLRTIVPQIPAFAACFVGMNVKYTALFVLLGGLATALDKYLRITYTWYPI